MTPPKKVKVSETKKAPAAKKGVSANKTAPAKKPVASKVTSIFSDDDSVASLTPPAVSKKAPAAAKPATSIAATKKAAPAKKAAAVSKSISIFSDDESSVVLDDSESDFDSPPATKKAAAAPKITKPKANSKPKAASKPKAKPLTLLDNFLDKSSPIAPSKKQDDSDAFSDDDSFGGPPAKPVKPSATKNTGSSTETYQKVCGNY